MKQFKFRYVLVLLFVLISTLDAGRAWALDENGKPYQDNETCPRCENMINNCPDGFMCFCGCASQELDDVRISNIIKLFRENNIGIQNIYSECMTDIYFGNGVWTSWEKAKKRYV
ncbi:MAG: hypothetical protein ACP5D3_01800 [Sulfurovum sp.]